MKLWQLVDGPAQLADEMAQLVDKAVQLVDEGSQIGWPMNADLKWVDRSEYDVTFFVEVWPFVKHTLKASCHLASCLWPRP